MALGPGKYDAEASEIRIRTNAAGVLLMILGGNQGTGFSVQASIAVQLNLPELLRLTADEIERELKS
jgi:hypothetical protein